MNLKELKSIDIELPKTIKGSVATLIPLTSSLNSHIECEPDELIKALIEQYSDSKKLANIQHTTFELSLPDSFTNKLYCLFEYHLNKDNKIDKFLLSIVVKLTEKDATALLMTSKLINEPLDGVISAVIKRDLYPKIVKVAKAEEAKHQTSDVKLSHEDFKRN